MIFLASDSEWYCGTCCSYCFCVRLFSATAINLSMTHQCVPTHHFHSNSMIMYDQLFAKELESNQQEKTAWKEHSACLFKQSKYGCGMCLCILSRSFTGNVFNQKEKEEDTPCRMSNHLKTSIVQQQIQVFLNHFSRSRSKITHLKKSQNINY